MGVLRTRGGAEPPPKQRRQGRKCWGAGPHQALWGQSVSCSERRRKTLRGQGWRKQLWRQTNWPAFRKVRDFSLIDILSGISEPRIPPPWVFLLGVKGGFWTPHKVPTTSQPLPAASATEGAPRLFGRALPGLTPKHLLETEDLVLFGRCSSNTVPPGLARMALISNAPLAS